MTTLLAKILLSRLHRVDPETLALLKIELQNFNRKTKRWQESATPISADVLR